MHEFLLNALAQNQFTAPDGKEYTMNHVFQAALDKGLSMESVVFDTGFVLDIGTPDDLFTAQRQQYTSAKKMMEHDRQEGK